MDHLSLAKALHTRRFWVAMVSAGLVVVNEGLGLNVPQEAVMPFAGIVISLLLGDAYIQGKHLSQGGALPSNKNTA